MGTNYAEEKYLDGRKNNGGARKNAGRPINENTRLLLEHLSEEIVVKELRHGQIRSVKKTRQIVMLDKLFNLALKEKNVAAARAYFDITVGKPRLETLKKPQKKEPSNKFDKRAFFRGIKIANIA